MQVNGGEDEPWIDLDHLERGHRLDTTTGDPAGIAILLVTMLKYSCRTCVDMTPKPVARARR